MKGALALAKEKPGTIGYATPGVGSIQQLSMELLAYLSGTKFLHVPYRGGAPALNDTIARPCAAQRAERVPGAALHPGRASSSRSR